MPPSFETSNNQNKTSALKRRGGFVASAIGQMAAWMIVLMVFVQFTIVVLRYLFGVNFIWAQEFVLALHGVSFMLIAPWTFLKMRHVRIDVFNEQFSKNTQSRLNKFGFYCLLLPMMVTIIASSIGYVTEAWSILEGSAELSGLPGKFLTKTIIPVFAVLMLMVGTVVFRNEQFSGVEDDKQDQP